MMTLYFHPRRDVKVGAGIQDIKVDENENLKQNIWCKLCVLESLKELKKEGNCVRTSCYSWSIAAFFVKFIRMIIQVVFCFHGVS